MLHSERNSNATKKPKMPQHYCYFTEKTLYKVVYLSMVGVSVFLNSIMYCKAPWEVMIFCYGLKLDSFIKCTTITKYKIPRYSSQLLGAQRCEVHAGSHWQKGITDILIICQLGLYSFVMGEQHVLSTSVLQAVELCTRKPGNKKVKTLGFGKCHSRKF